MASAVLSEIERIKQNELLAAFSRNEAAMLEKLVPAPRRDLAEHKEYLGPFIEWCTRHTVRHCQARPQTVATFIAEHAHRGEQFALNTI